jgi:hypothetical protein
MLGILATGGYMWAVVPVAQRAQYMDALAQASSQRNIVPFAQLLAQLAADQATCISQ